MFNKAYLRIVGICFVIAAPIAWQGVRMWLEGFAYKTPIPWVGILNRFIDRNRNHVIDREFPELESGERESGK